MMLNFLITFGRPVLEIGVIWFIIYRSLLFIKGTRAAYVLRGLLALIIILFFLAQLLNLETINWILTNLFAFGIIAFLIIFQQELRRGLAHLGQSPLFSAASKKEKLINEIVKSCLFLSRRKIGALIILQREMGLRAYFENSIILDSEISSELLNTIFLPSTPLHDGAVIIQQERITACGALLPLSENPHISKALGARHRAAFGISEETDATAIVVSEESGAISIAMNGKLTRELDEEHLRRILRNVYKPK